MVVISEVELLESGYVVRESDYDNEAHLEGVRNWQLLYPEVVQVEGSYSRLMQREHIVYRGISGSSSKHLGVDSVTTSIDHDPVVPSTSSSNISLITLEDLYQVERQTGNKLDHFGAPLEVNQSKLEDNDIAQDGDYNPNRIPSSIFATSDSLSREKWSAASNDSLFSLHGGGISFGRDQAALLAIESRKLKGTEDFTKLDEQTAFVEAGDKKAVAEESKVEEKDKSKEDVEKTQEEEAKHPSALAVMRSSFSCRSDGSEGSTFSFAFPILAPGRAQNNSTKKDASSHQTIHSREPHSGAGNSIGTPRSPPPPATKTSYLSCLYCCSFCSSRSCSSCSRSSCWPFKS